MKETIEERYKRICDTGSDINNHLPTLRRYAEQCEFVLEFGVSLANSTTAFLAAQPQLLVCVDTCWQPCLAELYPPDVVVGRGGFCGQVGKTRWEFINQSDLEIEVYHPDLLFIDTWHCYNQMKAELEMHAHNVKKWIICHDTTTFCWLGERIGSDDPIYKGIGPAICEYMAVHKERKIKEAFIENNGLLVLERSC